MASSVVPRDDSKDRVGRYSHAIKPEELKAGDHIYVYRFFYQHHGIYVDEEEVIHFSGPKGSGSKSEAKISAVSLKEFLKGDQVRLVAYNESRMKLLGTTHYEKSQPADRVISTAEMFLKYPELWPDYNVVNMNCEHFAYYCKTNNMELIEGQSVILCSLSSYVQFLSFLSNDQMSDSEYKRFFSVLKKFMIEEKDFQEITCYTAAMSKRYASSVFSVITSALEKLAAHRKFFFSNTLPNAYSSPKSS